MLTGLQSASATLRYDMVFLFEILFIGEFNCVKCGSTADFFFFFFFFFLFFFFFNEASFNHVQLYVLVMSLSSCAHVHIFY